MTCYLERLADGTRVIMCGDLGPQCRCGASSDFLCDYPVGDGKTCDASLCASCASEVAPDLHYCPSHKALWQEFKDGGGVKRELENVVPYKNAESRLPDITPEIDPRTAR